MALYVIGDTHLSLSTNKPMDVFYGWQNYMEILSENWRSKITSQDTVVIAGDVSWGLSLEESLLDFEYLQGLPGQKLLMKGNHDYWWTTRTKMESFFKEHGLDTIKILHNNSVAVEEKAICGSRGWLFEKGEAHDIKIINREAARLEMSLKAAKPGLEKVVFLHYPPIYGECITAEIIDVLLKYQVKRCYYGHIHSRATAYACNGIYMGIDFQLISGDYIKFDPVLVK